MLAEEAKLNPLTISSIPGLMPLTPLFAKKRPSKTSKLKRSSSFGIKSSKTTLIAIKRSWQSKRKS